MARKLSPFDRHIREMAKNPEFAGFFKGCSDRRGIEQQMGALVMENTVFWDDLLEMADRLPPELRPVEGEPLGLADWASVALGQGPVGQVVMDAFTLGLCFAWKRLQLTEKGE